MSQDERTDIPDSILPYLNEIAERLWSGHAAVMVGAGFSRNAKPSSTSGSEFPNWQQLGDVFYKKTYGVDPDGKAKYLSVLKIADEMQAALGRPALDQALRETIPNYDYEPSQLHVKLLEFPWADVFTTNYDTLLERACISVSSPRYDIVVNKEDLVYSEKPRIVKLHGSFPSERPFIITEEDYRRYPKDFAPFVNTVQQALLENTLCLIGFSGDDPNFLQWIGWIRDNLGSQNSPKIYLIGVLSLSEAQKKLLEQRNVVLVNMSGCQGVEGNHYKGLDQFFDYLLSKKAEENRLGWPNVELSQPDSKSEKSEQVNKLLDVWTQQRLSFPGWVIVPEDRRNSLWNSTKHWINFISSKDQLPDTLDLEFAFELAWRLDKCLCPIFNEQVEYFEAILAKYLPSPGALLASDRLEESEKVYTVRVINNKESMVMCQHLLISLMRYYREEGLLEKWNTLNASATEIFEYLLPETVSRLYYERSLYSLFKLDIQKLKDTLSEWNANTSLPFLEAKKAGLLAEIGQVEEATNILGQSLKTIREKLNLKPITTDYSFVSQESYIMLLSHYIKSSVSFRRGLFRDDQRIRENFSDRWNNLKQYSCDPWNELKLFENSLGRPPVEKRDVTEKQGFDIGRITRTMHFDSFDGEALLAYNFLRFFEDAGIPFRIPHSNFGKKSAEGTLERISKYSPYWAMATVVRIGDAKVVDSIFNRESLQKMESKNIDKLVFGYIDSIERNIDEIKSGKRFHEDNFGIVLAMVVPEILSRLCCKCSDEARMRIFTFLLSVYRSEHRANYGGIRNLTERLLNSYSVEKLFQMIPGLLNFPVLDGVGHIEELEFVNPFRFVHIGKELVNDLQAPVIQNELVLILLEKASSGSPKAREWAILTLDHLNSLGLLGLAAVNKFADVLWSQTDAFGLPDNTGYYKFSFLDLPHPDSVNPAKLFKKFIISESFPIQKHNKSKGIPFTRGDVPLCRELIGSKSSIQWSAAELDTLFVRLVEWWDADKGYLKPDDARSPFGSITEEFRARFEQLIEVLEFVVAPRFSYKTKAMTKSSLLRLITEMGLAGLPVLRLESACLHIYREIQCDIQHKIEEALASREHGIVIDALQGTLGIIEKNCSKYIDFSPKQLINVLGQFVYWRKVVGLRSVLIVLTKVVSKYSNLFTIDLEAPILVGLHNILKDTIADMDGVGVAERLAIRQRAAGLAYVIFVHHTVQNVPVPDVILEWKSTCLSDDEFAEIRKQWLHT